MLDHYHYSLIIEFINPFLKDTTGDFHNHLFKLSNLNLTILFIIHNHLFKFRNLNLIILFIFHNHQFMLSNLYLIIFFIFHNHSLFIVCGFHIIHLFVGFYFDNHL